MINLFTGFLALAASVAQVSLPLRWWPVDLPLLVTIFAGLSRGRGWGLASGLLAGLFLDALLGGPAGVRLAPLVVVGAAADALQGGVNPDQPLLQVLAVVALTAVHDALLAVFAHRLGVPQGGLQRALFEYGVPRLAAQGLVCLPLFGVLGLALRQRVFLDPRQRRVKMIRRWP